MRNKVEKKLKSGLSDRLGNQRGVRSLLMLRHPQFCNLHKKGHWCVKGKKPHPSRQPLLIIEQILVRLRMCVRGRQEIPRS